MDRLISENLLLRLFDGKVEQELPLFSKTMTKIIKGLPSAEPSGDAVSRQTVKEQMIKYGFHAPDMTVTEFVEDLPSVKPQERTGHWVKTPKAVMGEGYMWYCDKCEHQVYQDSSRPYPSEKYCPNCGCYMFEPQEVREVI